MRVFNYTISPGDAPRAGHLTIEERGGPGVRAWVFAGNVPIGNEIADAAIDRFLVDSTTSGTITVAVSDDVSAAARAYDFTVLPGASEFSGRIVYCRRRAVNVAHTLNVTTPNIRGETLVNAVGLPFAGGSVPDDPVAAIAVENYYEHADAVSGIVTLSIGA